MATPSKKADRVWENSTTTGTGTLTLNGGLPGFQSFNSAFGSGSNVEYAISFTANNQYETGWGITTGTNQLIRNQVYNSSNSGSLVNFGIGTKDVICTYTAEKALNYPLDSYDLTLSGSLGIGTSSPHTSLEVVGRIIGTNLVVGPYGSLNDTTGVAGTVQLGNSNATAFVANSADAYIYKLSSTVSGSAAGTIVNQTRSDTTAGGFIWVAGSSPATTVMSLSNSGALTVANGITVTASTSAFQAVTATTIVASGLISSTVTSGNIFVNTGHASTGYLTIEFSNTNGGMILGVNGSTAGSIFTGGTTYATCLGSYTNTHLQLGTNSVLAIDIDTSQNVTATTSIQTPVLTVGQSGANPYQLAMAYSAGQLLIQAQQSGITQQPLYLNPSGGGVSIGGATIGPNALAVTGSSAFSSTMNLNLATGPSLELAGGALFGATTTNLLSNPSVITNYNNGTSSFLYIQGTDGVAAGHGLIISEGSSRNWCIQLRTDSTPAINFVANSTLAGSFTGSGLMTLNYGLTVSSGTSALQAVMATSLTLNNAGSIANVISLTGRTSTNDSYIQFLQSDGSTQTAQFGAGIAGYFFQGSSGALGSLNQSGILTLPAYGAGAATFSSAGVISSASDERLKHVWGTFGKSMKDIPVNLRNVMIEYGWPDEMGTAYELLSHYIGQSAQKLQLAVPELVHSKHVLDPKTGKLTDTGRLSVFNPGVDALLWNTAADHEERVNKLEEKIANLEAILAKHNLN